MTNPRWSPDGTRVAFISNQSGSTEIDIVESRAATSGRSSRRRAPLLQPRRELAARSAGCEGHPASARVSVTDADGRFYAPAGAWIHADDGFDRSERRFEAHYFHARGDVTSRCPPDPIHVRDFARLRAALRAARAHDGRGRRPTDLAVNLDATVRADAGAPGAHGPLGQRRRACAHELWRRLPQHARRISRLRPRPKIYRSVNALIVNKEQRFPDIAYSGRQLDPASLADALVVHGQEYHTSYWGHLGLLNIAGSIILPGYAGYPNTAAASLYPMNADIADIGHARGALVGYVHPFDDPPEPLAKPHEAADERAAGRCRARQSRLHGDSRFQRPSHDRCGLVPPAELGISDSGGRRHRCDGEFRFAARTGRHEPRLCARARRPLERGAVARCAQSGAQPCDQRPVARIRARRRASRR